MKAWRLVRIGLAISATIVLLGASMVVAQSVATESPNWLEATNFTVSKTRDLPANQEPITRGYDCTWTVDRYGSKFCEYTTPLAKVTASGMIASDGTRVVLDSNTYGVLPVGAGWGDTLLLSWYDKTGSRANIATAKYNASNLIEGKVWDANLYKYVKQYTYKVGAVTNLRSGTATPIGLESSMVAFSANGRWMVAPLQKYTDPGSGTGTSLIRGIMLYDTTNWQGKLITTTTEVNSTSIDQAGANLAVSNDGRYVAVNGITTVDKRPELLIYDTTTCLDQTGLIGASYANNCEFNDVLNGRFRTPASTPVTTKTYPSNLLSSSGVENARHLRFNADNSLRFQGVYRRTSATTFSVAEYTATPDTTGEAPIAVLGMGDSYISGEGVRTYRKGTDIDDNKCHTSALSYPIIVGRAHYPANKVRTVACSGAKVEDIYAEKYLEESGSNIYPGQTSKKIPWLKSDNKPDRGNITRGFVERYNMPGYAMQKQISDKKIPRSVLLSVGGNDIHFSDIITSCVTPFTGEEDCYAYYQDRKALIKSINQQYEPLKSLYMSLKNDSQSKVYVMGYPQIAQVGGNCGVNAHLSAKEIDFGSKLISYLNLVISRAASDAGVKYIDTEQAFLGHKLCEGGADNLLAVNGLTNGDDNISIGIIVRGSSYYIGIGKESYHPTRYGHQLLANTVTSKANALTASMPNPTNLGLPPESATNDLLKGIPKHPYLNEDATYKWASSNNGIPIMFRGKKYRQNLLDIRPTSKNTIFMRSSPITIYEGQLKGGEEILIPEFIQPGFHTLEVVEERENGEVINHRQVVYVGATQTDIDGDGKPNEKSQCVYVPDSDLDVDRDGRDDACDGEIRDMAVLPEQPFIEDPADDTPDFPTDQTDAVDEPIQDLFVPTPLPIVKPPAGTGVGGVDAESEPQSSTSSSPNNPPQSQTGALPNTDVHTNAVSILLHSSTPKGLATTNNLTSLVEQTSGNVLGQFSKHGKLLKIETKKPVSNAKISTNKHKMGIVIVVITAILAVATYVLIKKHKRNDNLVL